MSDLNKILSDLNKSGEKSYTDEKQYNDEKEIRLAKSKEELNNNIQDRKQRKEYAEKIFTLIRIYLGCVLIILILSHWLHINDNVLNVLLSTTTANVLILFRFVAKYLFHTKN